MVTFYSNTYNKTKGQETEEMSVWEMYDESRNDALY